VIPAGMCRIVHEEAANPPGRRNLGPIACLLDLAEMPFEVKRLDSTD